MQQTADYIVVEGEVAEACHTDRMRNSLQHRPRHLLLRKIKWKLQVRS